MSIRASGIQTAIYANLNVAGVTGLLSTAYGVSAIFTDVPQVADSEAPGAFPYLTYSASIAPFATDDLTGGSAVIQIDIWSRNASQLANAALADAVIGVMDRQALSVTGHITTEFESLSWVRDPDGLTLHGIALFRSLHLG